MYHNNNVFTHRFYLPTLYRILILNQKCRKKFRNRIIWHKNQIKIKTGTASELYDSVSGMIACGEKMKPRVTNVLTFYDATLLTSFSM